MGYYRRDQPPSSARVKIVTAKNATFQEAYQFDPPDADDPTPPAWSLMPNFRLDVKAYFEQAVALLSLTSAAGQIVVDDPVNRLIHFNVPETSIVPPLVPGVYVYDLINFDNSVPPIRIPLMHGEFIVTDGVTGG
jgi:hypothetical protein